MVEGLEILDMNLNNIVKMKTVYSKDKLPVKEVHIPTQQDLQKWPHLQNIKLPQVEGNIGLLIGNNVPDAYAPLKVRTGPPGSPHAILSRIGWIIWNLIRVPEDESAGGIPLTMNRADVAAVEYLQEAHKLEKLVRQAINHDFPESLIDDQKEPSQEDKQFLKKVKKSTVYRDGHYQISLPLRSSEVIFPDNKLQAERRLQGIKVKMAKNSTYQEDYKNFMTTLLERGYAEEVPAKDLKRSDGRVWYIPHHGVYHPRKPGKMRVVFDCAAMYKGISLRKQLLPGPDLTNSLLGVLLRFRKEEVAVMGNIEAHVFSRCAYQQSSET
jgi:hypothetical protein